jgi:hypothetical protein
MAKSNARKSREKLAKQKGFDIHSMQRGGQYIQIDTTTKTTKTKAGKQDQNKHKKRFYSEFDQGDSAFHFINRKTKLRASFS